MSNLRKSVVFYGNTVAILSLLIEAWNFSYLWLTYRESEWRGALIPHFTNLDYSRLAIVGLILAVVGPIFFIWCLYHHEDENRRKDEEYGG